MTEEEMRSRIIELEESEKTLKADLEESNKKYTELESSFNTEKEMLESRITDLKEHNKELFLKVKSDVKPPIEGKTTETTTSCEDVIKSFM